MPPQRDPDSGVLIAFATFPDEETARRIAKELVELRLAACGNVVPRLHSIYRWQGKVEAADESLVVFKLDAARYPEFEQQLRALHPYDVPEIIAWPVQRGSPEYLAWVIDSCRSES